MNTAELTVAILAGGRGKRLQEQDKGLIPLQGKSLIQHVLERLVSHHQRFIISANRNLPTYRELGYTVVTDTQPNYPGPLAGIAAVLSVAETRWVLCVPCDMPRIPADLGLRLMAALENSEIQVAVAHDGERLQPLCCLLDQACLPNLQDYLAVGKRRVDQWVKSMNAVVVDFSDCGEGFINVNSAEDLAGLGEGSALGRDL